MFKRKAKSAALQVPLHTQPSNQSFWGTTKKEFRRNRMAMLAFYVISFLLFIALFADFIAYNKPFYAVYKGETYFPILKDYGTAIGVTSWEPDLRKAEWRKLELESSVWPLITYLPNDIDEDNMPGKSPAGEQVVSQSRFWHYLGTDDLGRDLAAGLIHGTRISLTIGVLAAGISAIIGILMGALAGYFGDNRLKTTRGRLIMTLIGIVFGFFYAFFVRRYAIGESLAEGFASFGGAMLLSVGIFAAVIFVFNQVGGLLSKLKPLSKSLFVPVDIIISRIIELMVSIPILLLIITVAAIAEPSLYLVMTIIGLTTWPSIARFTRGEMLKVRNLEYIQAAQAQGLSEWRIILRHALPNSLAPVFVAVAFGVASAILIESSLSFLNVGVPVDTITWGKLLTVARTNIGLWWMAIFPGLAIFLTVTCFNLMGEGLRDALDPKLRK